MRILLANPPCRIDLPEENERYFVRAGSRWPFSTLKKKNHKPEYVPFPFYLAYCAALLEKNNHDVFVIDAIPLNLNVQEFRKLVSDCSPDCILFETSTPTINYDLKLVKELKRDTSAIIILAGSHATVFPEEVMNTSSEVDFILLGEYELNFLDLIKNLGTTLPIPGLVYRNKGRIINGGRGNPIDLLDKLPYPAYDLFPVSPNVNLSSYPVFQNAYWDGFCQYRPTVQMHSSRGCPFKCNFCLWNQVMYDSGKYRMFSPKRVVDEMEYVIKEFRPKEIYFDDDSFTINKEHVLGICEEIMKRGIKIHWSCMGDAMVTDEDMLRKMAASGCIGMKFGVESGNKSILKNINKPIDFKRVRKTAELCAALGIKTHATFSFGLLGETEQTMLETMQFSKQLDVDTVQFSITTPFPGTKYFDEMSKRDLLSYKHWSDFDGANSFVVNNKNLPNNIVSEFCDKARGEWLREKYKDIKWDIRQIRNMLRVLKGQGISAFFSRIKMGIRLLLNK